MLKLSAFVSLPSLTLEGGIGMATEDFKRKLTAILSADVKGYSRLMGEDDEATVRTITAYREVITEVVQKHKGREAEWWTPLVITYWQNLPA
jgi:class 3 adenylate cyclase